jgi:hypothetical protein
MTRRKRDDPVGQDPESLEPGSNAPETYPQGDPAPPTAPGGLDPSDTPIVSDSPRRALSSGRFGNPRKEQLADQPANSDSVTDDEPMEPPEERSVRDADFPDDEPGMPPSPRRAPRRKE